MSNLNNIPPCLDIFIILPSQLFFTQYAVECLCCAEYVYIIEAPEYFTESAAAATTRTMQNYKKTLQQYFSTRPPGTAVPNIKYIKRAQFAPHASFFEMFRAIKSRIMMFQIAEYHKFKIIYREKTNGLYIKFFSSPGFLFDQGLLDLLKIPSTYKFASFYKKGRKIFTPQLNPKVNGKFAPIGGKYMLDGDEAAAAPQKTAAMPEDHVAAAQLLCDFIRGGSGQIEALLNNGLLTPHQILSGLIDELGPANVTKYEWFMRRIFMREYNRAMYYLHKKNAKLFLCSPSN